MLSTYIRLGFPSGLFSSAIHTKILRIFTFSPYGSHDPPILSALICSTEPYLVRSRKDGTPHYADFSTLILIPFP